MKTRFVLYSFVLALAACGQQADDGAEENAAADAPVTEAAEAPAPATSIYAEALANPDRLEGDYARDATRKPDAVLEFFGIGRGDAVLEMFAGGGYYTEMLAHVVGEEGHVVAHMNTPLVNFGGDVYVARHADGRLANVEVLMAENNELELDANAYDAITMVLNYHDLYWASDEYGWDAIDVEPLLNELYDSLRPGGILGVVDHYAAPGSPAETGNTVHRIDPDVAIADLTAVGFVLDGETDILRNPDDDHSKSVFDPSVRGKTDRFVLRFKKPE